MLVIAGTGSNNTTEAVRLTKSAEKAGADASLLICPYYNKPTQDGLYLHFKAIAEESNLPLIPYNIASRTGVNMEPETIAHLAELPTIVGIKEASGNLDQMSQIIRLCKENIVLLSGDDSLTLPVLAIGGTGVISVVANIMPKETAEMVAAFEQGDNLHNLLRVETARRIHYKLLPLIKMLFIETNPTPVKTAMGMMGMCSPEVRLPLAPMKEQNKIKLKSVLEELELFK
jgi:4-hydroxy-tetrahydrodipicolinate synthase